MIMTNEEIDRLKKLFLALDTTKDGFISSDEFNDGLSEIMGLIKSQGLEIDKMLQQID
jgi:Ca2+-binding EF-hand superfamily protein